MPDGSSRYGGPVYDATIHPATANIEGSRADRLAFDSGLHFFYGKSAAADVYSHYREQTPNQTAIALMGLSQQFNAISRQVERKNDLPFPGVPLGHTPGFHRSPDTSPVVAPVNHFAQNAHKVESLRKTRRRFGRG